ncbi:urea transporter [Nitrosomonas ureae]|uniref:Urea transporter n=1 Tax=Nitrosomonas ureae TaxID=44577 RepID=A0A1H5UK11_9PROT|nr:urea transporter [Nitrosomonas ureae]SEF75362.1 Urea transporter [Nitrosomonas ureae]
MSWLLNFDKMLPGILRVLLRGAGQVVFCGNAATGLCVLMALYVGGIITGLAATIGLISSTVTAYALKFCKEDIEAGLYGFNGVLAGSLSINISRTYAPVLALHRTCIHAIGRPMDRSDKGVEDV